MKTKTSTVKKFRIQRRLNTDLPGLGKAGALNRRPYAPGQHGAARKKHSEYALRLREKQKLMAHYNLTERQLQCFVSHSRKAAINWIAELSRRLELRLDNLIFRAQLAPSTRAARQLVSHKHILIGGRPVNIGSQICKVGDEIQIKEKSRVHPSVVQAASQPRLDLPAYLEKKDGFTVRIVAEPTTADVPFSYSDRLIAEYYATRGRK